jgi:hypothetical protein
LAVFGVSAQTPLDLDGLPDPRPLHLPQSSTNKATIGTISGDGDYFMSVLDWSSIKNMDTNLFLAGVDENGLSIGYAQRVGKFYLGASYSGSLIDELFRRMTNQNVLTLRKQDTIKSGSYDTSLLDQNDETPSGETISNNDINLILGSGTFGLRLGFAEWIRAVEISSPGTDPWNKETTFESSLKPSVELGFNFKAGPVRVKPALSLAFDIHEFNSTIGTGSSTTQGWSVHERIINFYEPSAGFTLGFDFANSETASAELILDGNLAFRFYRTQDDPDSVRSFWNVLIISPTPPDFPIGATRTAEFNVTIPTDLRISGAPRFVYTGDIGQRLSLGVKLQLGTGLDILTIEQKEDKSGVEHSSSITSFTITPDFSIGASFHLIPDHFSLHAGLGFTLFSFKEVKTERDTGGTTTEETTKTMNLPSARFAAGLTLNLTEAVAMDLMAITSGISVDATKFTLLLTVKN